MRALFIAIVGLGCGSAGTPRTEPAEQAPSGTLGNPEAPLPATMTELGLYPDAADFEAVHPRAVPFRPAYELWSNGSSKRRYLVLPEGTSVDTTERGLWQFPVGARLLKTFFYPGHDGRERPVETRVLSRKDAGFEYHAYLWDEGASDAALLELDRPVPVPVELDGERFEHVVPARLDCRKCHESQTSAVIGFDELRLNAGLAAGEPTQLEELAARGVLSGPLPAEPESITHPDETTRQTLGYLHGNCAHCHNGGSGASSAFDMRHGIALENLVGRETEGEAIAGIRVVPGKPEESALYLALTREAIENIQPMPPVGVQRADQTGIELVASWIRALVAP